MTTNEPNLAEIAALAGYREIPEVLAAAATPLERGHHLALAAGRGAGEDAVYALAVASACGPEDGVQALVVVPTRDRALDVALSMQRAVAPSSLRVSVPPLRVDGSVDTGATDAQCLVERPSVLLPEVRLGRLGLGNLRLLAVDGLADLVEIDEWESAAPLVDTLQEDTRRIVVSRRADESLGTFIRDHLPRGRRWPHELFGDPNEAAGGAATEAVGAVDQPRARVNFGQAPTEVERLGVLLRAVRDLPEPSRVRVRCRSETSVPGVAAALAAAGLSVASGDDEWDLDAAPGSSTSGPTAHVWFGMPLSVERLLQGEPDSFLLAIVDVAHRPQLELMTTRARMELRLLPGLVPAAELDPLGRYRALVRARIEKGSTDAELLVLEPLLREFGTTRVAAAVSDLFRRSAAGDPGVRPWPDVEEASRGPRRKAGSRVERESGPEHRGARGAWSTIYVGAGKRDSVRAADLVGAITGETGVAGGQIGKIDIRGNFSLIEIDSQVVDDVIRKLNGSTIRGRDVTVRLDRGD